MEVVLNDQSQKTCLRCVMDTSDIDITFDDKGICHNCTDFLEKKQVRILSGEKGAQILNEIVGKIKSAGENKQYDCIIGVSGGVDSTYVAYLAKEMGLRILAVHFDNGWNSELAVSNIEKVLNKLKIDLYTYVIDWEEFKDLQLAFLRASTPDSEIPTDHAINALLYKIASEQGIKYIISGSNFADEGILPESWAYGHLDWRYIKNIHKTFGKVKLKTFPRITVLKYIYLLAVKRIKQISLLNYMEFDKSKAMDVLQNELGWRYYGGKHYESIYTRFFQGYILPQKFGIDKRRAHYSSLICGSGAMTRDEALEELQKDTYSQDLVKQDREYLIKKFRLKEGDFEEIMSLPKKTFNDYKNNYSLFKTLRKILFYLRSKRLFYR